MEERRAASARHGQSATLLDTSGSKKGSADGLRAAAARAVAASRHRQSGSLAATAQLSTSSVSAISNPLKRRRVRDGGEEEFWSPAPSPDFQSPVVVETHTSEAAVPRRNGEATEPRRLASRAGPASGVRTAADGCRPCGLAEDAVAAGTAGEKQKRQKHRSVATHSGSSERLDDEAYEVPGRDTSAGNSDGAGTDSLLGESVSRQDAAKAADPPPAEASSLCRAAVNKSAGDTREGKRASAVSKTATRAGTPSRGHAARTGAAASEKENEALQRRRPLPSLKNLYVQLSDDEGDSPAAATGTLPLQSFPLSGNRAPAARTEEQRDAGDHAPGDAQEGFSETCGDERRGLARAYPSLLTHTEGSVSHGDSEKEFAVRSVSAAGTVLPESSCEGGPLGGTREAERQAQRTPTRRGNKATAHSKEDGDTFDDSAPGVCLAPSSGLPVLPPQEWNRGLYSHPPGFSPLAASATQHAAAFSSPFPSVPAFQSSVSPHALGARRRASTLPLDSPWHAVPAPLRKAVAECMYSFGRERARELSRLVALLGDVSHPVSPIEVVGLPGSGKSHLLLSFFGASPLAWGYVDCAAACATAGAGRLAARQAICGKLLLHLALQLRRELLAGLHTVRALAAKNKSRVETQASQKAQEAETTQHPEEGGEFEQRRDEKKETQGRQMRASARSHGTKRDDASPASSRKKVTSSTDSTGSASPRASDSTGRPLSSDVSPSLQTSSASPFASSVALESLEAELKEKKTLLDRLMRQMQSGKRSAETLAFSGSLFSAGFSANSVEQFVSLLRQLLRCSSPLTRAFSVPLVIDEAFTLAQNMPDLLHALLRLPELLGGEARLRSSPTFELDSFSPPRLRSSDAARRGNPDETQGEDPRALECFLSSEEALEDKELLVPPRNVCVILVGRSPLRPEIFEGFPQPPRVHFRAYEGSEARDILARSFQALGLPVLRLAAAQQATRPRLGAEKTQQCTDTAERGARQDIWVYGHLELLEQRTVVARGWRRKGQDDAEQIGEAEVAGVASEQARRREEREEGKDEDCVWESRLVLRRMRRRARKASKMEGLSSSTDLASETRRGGVPSTEREEQGEGAEEESLQEAREPQMVAGKRRTRSEGAGREAGHVQAASTSLDSAESTACAGEGLWSAEEVDLLLDVEVLWSHFVTLFIQAFHQSLKSDFHEQRFLCREFWGQAMNLLLLQNRDDAGISALTAAATQQAALHSSTAPFSSSASVRAASVSAASFLSRLLHPHFRAALRQPFSHFLPDLQNCQILEARHRTVWGASAQDRHTAARRLELPRLGKVLLVAAALAAYTPASRDKRHFNDCFGNVFRVARPRHAPLLQSPLLLATGAKAEALHPGTPGSPRKPGKSVAEKLEQDFLPRALPKTFSLLRWLALAECLDTAAGKRQASIGLMDAGTCQQVVALLRLGLVRPASGGGESRANGGFGLWGVLSTSSQTWGSEWTQPLGWVLGQQQFIAAHARKMDAFLGGPAGASGHAADLFNSNARLALHAPLAVVKESADSLGINLVDALVG
ncbi:hypothetical protein TGME49_232970 [Toxoplasma gondii ME49]|uniref:Origin recognition complex subunit 5 C-terminal domain-containing protein n=2 Tax=Toxoplasma gondii TaxID=5811 RepID=B6KJY3_TOXGV|nr:hypothetical protein TGME49_232970 [Toxoplasma gondii ME49]EPT28813.1 hypothetical protein TGME49_232970 [Toxoplasma gondii ME49]ESS35888.1 hypothetical protein TGVEG_232970 [Toxoplasma gondii VEG]CEL74964.1 TPA: hypothetical protein BN1205_022670 [Toxoplasma gondii VEG]|eukprot:XP_002368156.1 hypothetical protein TGME49_232970 [Toxoplasma gondii ME49]